MNNIGWIAGRVPICCENLHSCQFFKRTLIFKLDIILGYYPWILPLPIFQTDTHFQVGYYPWHQELEMALCQSNQSQGWTFKKLA